MDNRPQTDGTGELLLEFFLVYELQQDHLSATDVQSIFNNLPPGNDDIDRLTESLREQADVLARSHLRNNIRAAAMSVNPASLNFNHLCDILETLFKEGGVSSERVVVAFLFFCDLIKRCMKKKKVLCSVVRMFRKYVVQRLNAWVKRRGGWVAVLCPVVRATRYITYKILAILFFLLGLGAYVTVNGNNFH